MKNNKWEGSESFPLNVKAVVFDLDGTLMNTLADIANIANKVLESMGYKPIEEDKYRYFLGNGAGALLDSIHREVNMDPGHIEAFDREYMDLYSKSEIGPESIYEGIFDLVGGLKKKGIRLGVLTNKPHHIAVPLMERVMPGVFDYVFGQQEAYPRKPDPFGLEFLSRELSFERDQVVYLGDTNTDMETGRGYGAFTVGVLWGFRDEEELLGAGAQLIIKKPQDLLEYL